MQIVICCFVVATLLLFGPSSGNDAVDVEYLRTEDNDGNSTAVNEETCGGIVNKSGLLPHKGVLNGSKTCEWNVIGSESHGSSALFFEDVNLHDTDNFIITSDGNETLFGPYHGALGPLVVVVNRANFTVSLHISNSSKMLRTFDVVYNINCTFAPPPKIEVIQAPIYQPGENVIHCLYDYNENTPNSLSLVFADFNLSSGSSLEISNTKTQDNIYRNADKLPDIFNEDKVTRFNISLNTNSSEASKFTIMRRKVNGNCSGIITSVHARELKSPNQMEFYDSNTSFECRWLVKSDPGKNSVIGLNISTLQFANIFDTLAIADGPSEISPPIVQAAFMNQNETKARIIRSSGPNMLISFRSHAFVSNFTGEFGLYDQGGYHKGSGSISATTDTEFLLEVAEGENVLLNFSSSGITDPASIDIYDGFESTSNLIAHLTGDIWYPVISGTSKMRVVTKNFASGKFDANFNGIKSGCLHMSTSPNDAYVLSGNCLSNCAWVVPPSVLDGVLQLEFKLLSLDVNDTVEVFSLTKKETPVAKIPYGTSHFSQLTFNPKEGLSVKVSRGDCSKTVNDVALIAQSTYLPGCSENITLEPNKVRQVASPNYPNTYPVLGSCQWNISSAGNTTLYHLAFNKFELAPNHCLEITHDQSKTVLKSGDPMPGDMLLANVAINFNSLNCNGTAIPGTLDSDEGFAIDVTSLDCGEILTTASGMFSTSLPTNKGNSSCAWLVQVPFLESNGSTNSIKFTVEQKGDGDQKGYEFHVYNGTSVRDREIKDLTGSGAWSYDNTLLFVYRRLNASLPSPVFTVNYQTINCNKSMQCSNQICLHPDWRCNGINDCGDFSDEKNCGTVPIPPDDVKETSSVSSVTFGIVTVLFFVLGIVAAVFIPKAVNRYRERRYHQFQDYPGPE